MDMSNRKNLTRTRSSWALWQQNSWAKIESKIQEQIDACTSRLETCDTRDVERLQGRVSALRYVLSPEFKASCEDLTGDGQTEEYNQYEEE